MTALARLLTLYATAPSQRWSAFDARLEGIEWSDSAPVANPDTRPPETHSRSGRLVLAGFGDNDLPNGKTGPDADYERGNEGRSGVTLNGSADEVTSIAVMKFYPDADYAQVLRQQLGSQGQVRLIADQCALTEGTTTGEPDASSTRFFEITLPGAEKLYAEGGVDEDGGKYSPGSTTYFFYRSRPTERIASMQCKST